jgi:Camelysin metallo-endopeptidase
MRFLSKKRLLLTAGGVSTVAAAGMLVAGTTFGLFSASNQQAGTNSFTAGNVSLGSPVQAVCNISNMVPGNSSTGYSPTPSGQTNTETAPCSFSVTYTGSAPAYLAVDVTVGGTSLYDETVNGLQLQISDGTTSYTTDGALNGTSDLLVSATPDAGSSNAVHTLTVNYALPKTADNTYQNLNSTLQFTIHAVQSGNNNFVGSCTAGQTCGTATDWS